MGFEKEVSFSSVFFFFLKTSRGGRRGEVACRGTFLEKKGKEKRKRKKSCYCFYYKDSVVVFVVVHCLLLFCIGKGIIV